MASEARTGARPQASIRPEIFSLDEIELGYMIGSNDRGLNQ
jgi:hypothetical protein